MKKQGFSLVEMMVGGLVLAFAIGLVLKLFQGQQKVLVDERKNAERRDDINVLSGYLQKFVSGGDVHFVAFTGRTEARSLVRFLVPQPGRCADLTSNCPGGTSFVFVGYDRSTTPAISGGCDLGPASGGGAPRPRRILIDLKAETYGKAVINGDQVQVSPPSSGIAMPTGKIKMASGSVLALLDPPYAQLWKVASSISALNLTQNTTSGVISLGGTPIPPSCVEALSAEAAGRRQNLIGATGLWRLDLSDLASVSIDPFVMTPFTSGSAVPEAEAAARIGSFPKRIFAAEMRSIGPSANGAELRACVSAAAGGIDCSVKSILRVDGVKTMRLTAKYKLAFQGSPAENFEYVPTGGVASPTCTAPLCAALPVPNLAQIPSQTTISGQDEDFSRLDPSRFSFVKNDSLSSLYFSFELSDGRQEGFRVQF